MTVQITPTATQHTGMTVSAEGSVAAWHVTFQIQHDERSPTSPYPSRCRARPRTKRRNRRR